MSIIETSFEGGVATVTLNRPERRNALNGELTRALRQTMADTDGRDDVSVIVLTGADPAFCAGVDLKELGSGRRGSVTVSGVGRSGAARPWERTVKPVIGAINGAAITGGLELALQCDFLVASERAVFADTHSRVGILPGWGLTVLLPQAVGLRRAKEMSLTGNFVSAEVALAWGLVNHVIPHDELLPFARKLAADISGNDQRSARRMLAEYDEVTSTTIAEGLEIEARIATEWNGDGSAASDVERRRQAIIERGRSQV
ncbi:MAG TPA: enoyl-CoA hydratase [Acidimicrobiales bacterium]|jgi:enoyl-CoA hydratase|nr:enoyl-CoA hydratase [Acidimicrobiales bacterium]